MLATLFTFPIVVSFAMAALLLGVTVIGVLGIIDTSYRDSEDYLLVFAFLFLTVMFVVIGFLNISDQRDIEKREREFDNFLDEYIQDGELFTVHEDGKGFTYYDENGKACVAYYYESPVDSSYQVELDSCSAK